MTVQNLPNEGDKLYLHHREVIVLKVYEIFQLIKIHYPEELVEFFVDICALTEQPDTTNSISLGLIGGNRS